MWNQLRRSFVAGTFALAWAPVLLNANSDGPVPRRTGAPGDQTCADGCHTGTAVNGGPGKVEIAFPSGLTYTPGVKQRWTVTVTDAQQSRFGFEATARLASNPAAGQAGTFTPADTTTQVICDDGAPRPASGCRAGFTVEFIEHAAAGRANSFTFEWTPPAAGAGDVRVYVAGNAANGNGSNSGDRIYTANYTLTPAAAPVDRPVISQGGVAEAFNFGRGVVASSTWLAIGGSNLASTTKTWDEAVRGNQLPTTLEGVSVSINNRPATVFFVSPTQVNVLAPLDDSVGDGIQVVLRNERGASDPVTVRKQAALPAFYAPFAQGGRFYVTGVALDGAFVGRQGLDPRVTRGARPGEVILLFGTGFGATTPAVPTDQVVTGAPTVNTPPDIRIGEVEAAYARPGNLVAAGLYQFNVTIPSTLADGEHAITAEVGGVRSSTSVYIIVQR